MITVVEETPVDEIARLMERHFIKRVPVTRDNKVVGIVSRQISCASLPASLTRRPRLLRMIWLFVSKS